MYRKFIFLLLLLVILAPASMAIAQEPQGLPVNLPRQEMFVIDQIFRYGVAVN